MDDRSQRWTQMRIDACEATWLRGEQSSTMLDRRMACLDRRLDETAAAVDLLRRADASVVRNAGQVVHGLPDLRRCADTDRLRAQVSPPDDPTMLARVDEARRTLAKAWAASAAARFDEVDASLTRLERDAKRIGYGPLQAEVTLARGLWHDDTGAPQQAAQILADAAKLARSVGDDRTEAEAFLALTRVWGARLRDVKRASFYAELAQAAIADGGDDAALSAVLHFERGTLAFTEGRDAQARGELQRALEIQRELHGDAHPAYAKVLGRLAGVYFRAGERDVAIDALRHVIDIQTQVHGRTHPQVAAPLGNLGLVLSAVGRHDEAIDAMREAKDILERVFGPEHPAVAEAHDSIGHVLALDGQTDRARAHFRRSIELYRAIGERGHPGRAAPLLGLGQLEVDAGRPEHAIEPLQEAAGLLEEIAATPVQRADTLFALARALGDTGQTKRARALAEQAREIYADPSLAGDPRVAQIEGWLATNGE